MKETVLWATKIGEPDSFEQVITSTSNPEYLEQAKAWAKANRFDRLRTKQLAKCKADFTGVIAPI